MFLDCVNTKASKGNKMWETEIEDQRKAFVPRQQSNNTMAALGWLVCETKRSYICSRIDFVSLFLADYPFS